MVSTNLSSKAEKSGITYTESNITKVKRRPTHSLVFNMLGNAKTNLKEISWNAPNFRQM